MAPARFTLARTSFSLQVASIVRSRPAQYSRLQPRACRLSELLGEWQQNIQHSVGGANRTRPSIHRAAYDMRKRCLRSNCAKVTWRLTGDAKFASVIAVQTQGRIRHANTLPSGATRPKSPSVSQVVQSLRWRSILTRRSAGQRSGQSAVLPLRRLDLGSEPILAFTQSASGVGFGERELESDDVEHGVLDAGWSRRCCIEVVQNMRVASSTRGWLLRQVSVVIFCSPSRSRQHAR
jgi:hypothetical protein